MDTVRAPWSKILKIQRAVIFDMDGVITDSEPLYAEAMDIVLSKHGIALAPEDYRAVIGSSTAFTWQYVIDRFNLGGGIQEWIRVYDEAVAEILSTKRTASEGLHWLLECLASKGVRVGLATGSKTRWTEIILNRISVVTFFEAVATADMVSASKPEPDLYLLAANKLGVSPVNCLAIEDTPRGIAAAKSAGMDSVAVRTESTAGLDISAADYVISSLCEFDFTWVEELS
ncbi:MAG: HAD family phosphatase [Chloroflexi bacterium]|nr:HAD family phosphatase [Chloroflexota bacterium]